MIDVAKLREWGAAELLRGSRTTPNEFLNALPELLAVYEAACAYADAERTERRYSATQYHALLATVDAARKSTT